MKVFIKLLVLLYRTQIYAQNYILVIVYSIPDKSKKLKYYD